LVNLEDIIKCVDTLFPDLGTPKIRRGQRAIAEDVQAGYGVNVWREDGQHMDGWLQDTSERSKIKMQGCGKSVMR
jgi:hypothetical protein